MFPSVSTHEAGINQQSVSVGTMRHGTTGAAISAVNSGARTTLSGTWPGPGGKRWYDYTDMIDIATGNQAAGTGLDIWFDSSAYFGYSNGSGGYEYDINNFVSYGLGLDATYSAWNDALNFPSVIAVAPQDSFYIDSVEVAGWYNRSYASAAKDSVVDTLIFTFVNSGWGTTGQNMDLNYFNNATLLSEYGLPSTGQLNFASLLCDSSNHRAGDLSGTSVVSVPATAMYKFLLYKSDTNNSNSFSGTQFPRLGRTTIGRPADPVMHFSVPAGHLAAMSVTFHSGDHTYPAFPTHDTIRYVNSAGDVTGYKYGNFEPVITYASSSPSSSPAPAEWYPYSATNTDYTSGYFKIDSKNASTYGWGFEYYPNWAFSDNSTSPASASELQFPLIDYHVVCGSCNMTGATALGVNSVAAANSVTVFPNPAHNMLNVNFTAASATTVSLMNVMGQVVAKQTVTGGTASFNVADLASGVYIYSIESAGNHTTGRVVVAH